VHHLDLVLLLGDDPSAKRRAVDATKGSAARAEAASAIPRSKTLKRRMKSPRLKALV